MKPFRNPLVIYSSIVAFCAVVVLGGMLASPSEPGNAIIFGFSLPRLVLALGLLFAFVIFFWITIKAAKDQEWAEQFLEEWFGWGRFSGVAGWLGGISFGLGWTGLFVPPYFWGRYESYLVRIQPVMVFTLLMGIATLLFLYVRRRSAAFFVQSNSGLIRSGVIMFLACLIVAGFMLYSRFGIALPDDFWYGAGVPTLVPQLIAAVLAGIAFLQVERKWSFKYFDLFVFILVFSVTAFLWTREPLQKGFSFVENPADNVLYPFFDAAIFDIASQFALIGQKMVFYGGYFPERPLYMAFLVYLHAVFGQDYAVLMAGQAFLYAVFPPIIYLIGRSLGFRAVGFSAAVIAMFRGLNAIAGSNWMDLAGPKMILTDFPAAIGVALVLLAACAWLNQPDAKWHQALWVGGALGFTLMLRTNALMLLALLPLSAVFVFYKDRRKWLFHSFLLVVGVVAITLPWELRNRSLGGQMYGPIIEKFRAVIYTRYTSPPDPDSSLNQSLSPLVFKSAQVLSVLYQGEIARFDAPCDAVTCFVPNHFLHNIVTSVLVFPTSPVMDDLRHTVIDSNPYWRQHWDGTFALPSLLLIARNLFLILLGISISWQKRRWVGITPLAIFMFYNLSNAFARTSGGRYIVPMDWILTIYFLLGGMYIIIWIAESLGGHWQVKPRDAREAKTPVNKVMKTAFVLVVLFGFGALIPLAERLSPDRYQNFDIGATLVNNEQALSAVGLDVDSIDAFLQQNGAGVLVGRALYPRYYKKDRGASVFQPTIVLPFPRMTFNLIGPDGLQGVILPGDLPVHFPHAGDMLVIGCREQDHFDALAVIILDETNALYTRSPESELTCPLRQPVCDNNSVCK